MLATELSYHLKAIGDLAGARPHLERALAICEKVLGREHTETAGTLNNLAFLHRRQGRYAEAEPLYRQALEIRRTVLGESHPDCAHSLQVEE